MKCNGLPKYLSDDLERLQKRVLRIIFTSINYSDALQASNLIPLHDRMEALSSRLFEEICNNSNHKLYHLLPEINKCSLDLRNKRTFIVPICKTNRLKNSFMYSNCFWFPYSSVPLMFSSDSCTYFIMDLFLIFYYVVTFSFIYIYIYIYIVL